MTIVMHSCHRDMFIGDSGSFLIYASPSSCLSFCLCADMFPYEDSKTVSVCPSVYTPRNENLPGFVNICPTLVIDTSMERSSRVLQHGNRKIWFFSKKIRLSSKLNFDLCQRAEVIREGLNMHLYDDIGDASSSLRGSTSSLSGDISAPDMFPWAHASVCLYFCGSSPSPSIFVSKVDTSNWFICACADVIHVNRKIFSSTSPYHDDIFSNFKFIRLWV